MGSLLQEPMDGHNLQPSNGHGVFSHNEYGEPNECGSLWFQFFSSCFSQNEMIIPSDHFFVE